MASPQLPAKLQQWLDQCPGARLSEADRDFVRDVRIYAAIGVGFGFMQQVVEWLWQEQATRDGLPGSAWGPEYFNARIKELEAENARMRKALEALSCLGNGDRPGTSVGNRIAQAALAGE